MNQHTQGYLSDTRIIELYFGRDEDAIRETDRKYGALLHSIARGFLTDEMDCEECVSDTYLGAWHAIPPTRPGSLRAFLAQILRRLCINRHRERSAKSRVPSEYTASIEELSEVLSSSDTVESAWESAELRRLINDFLATLTSRERYEFIGRFYMARTLDSLAADMQLHVSTVHRDIERLRRRLREHLERNGFEI